MEYTITEQGNSYIVAVPAGEASSHIQERFEGFIWKVEKTLDVILFYLWNMDENDSGIIAAIEEDLQEREYKRKS